MGVSYVTENKKVCLVGGTALLAYIMYKSFDKKQEVKDPVEGENLQRAEINVNEEVIPEDVSSESESIHDNDTPPDDKIKDDVSTDNMHNALGLDNVATGRLECEVPYRMSDRQAIRALRRSISEIHGVSPDAVSITIDDESFVILDAEEIRRQRNPANRDPTSLDSSFVAVSREEAKTGSIPEN